MNTLEGRLDACAINTATLGHRPLSGMIDKVARAGFGGIAIWRRDVVDIDLSQVRRQAGDAGLKVTGFCRSTGIPANSTDEYVRNLADNRTAIAQAAELGARCFHMVAGGLPARSKDLPGARHQFADGIAELLPFAEQHGVALAIEPLNPMYAADRSVLVSLDDALDLCDALDPTNQRGIGVTVDLWHCWWESRLAANIKRATARRLLSFHVCDWALPIKDWVFDRAMMGDGVIDIRAIRATMEQGGYDGLIEVEILSAEKWWKCDMDQTLAVCAQRLQSLC